MPLFVGDLRRYPEKPTDIYLFATCFVDLFDPDAGMATVKLLEREGIRVHFPQEQTCCGQPAYTSGYPDEARRVAAMQLALFPQPWPVVVPSGSCAGMMRHHYPALFSDDSPMQAQATGLAERVFELTEFLVNVCRVNFTELPAMKGQCRSVLHTSCAGRREMRTHLTSRALMAQLEGVETVMQEHESECCGFGGTFSITHPHISSAMAADKVDALLATGANSIVSADCGCLSNINGTLAKRGSPVRGQHIATFIWQRTGGEA